MRIRNVFLIAILLLTMLSLNIGESSASPAHQGCDWGQFGELFYVRDISTSDYPCQVGMYHDLKLGTYAIWQNPHTTDWSSVDISEVTSPKVLDEYYAFEYEGTAQLMVLQSVPSVELKSYILVDGEDPIEAFSEGDSTNSREYQLFNKFDSPCNSFGQIDVLKWFYRDFTGDPEMLDFVIPIKKGWGLWDSFSGCRLAKASLLVSEDNELTYYTFFMWQGPEIFRAISEPVQSDEYLHILDASTTDLDGELVTSDGVATFYAYQYDGLLFKVEVSEEGLTYVDGWNTWPSLINLANLITPGQNPGYTEAVILFPYRPVTYQIGNIQTDYWECEASSCEMSITVTGDDGQKFFAEYKARLEVNNLGQTGWVVNLVGQEIQN